MNTKQPTTAEAIAELVLSADPLAMNQIKAILKQQQLDKHEGEEHFDEFDITITGKPTSHSKKLF